MLLGTVPLSARVPTMLGIQTPERRTAASYEHELAEHRVVEIVLSLESRKEANAEAASRPSIAADRVQAIAGLHHHLHSMDGTPTVDFKPYLERLCRDHSTMSMSEERPDQLIAVDAIDLSLTAVAPRASIRRPNLSPNQEHAMNNIIWWVGAIVIVLFVLGYLGFNR